MFNRPLLPVLLLLLIAALVWLQRPTVSSVSRTALLMGTLVEIKALGEDREPLAAAIDAAFAEMIRLEQIFSTHLADSEVSRISAAAGPFEVSAELAEVLAQGQQVAEQSGGAFDMTLHRLKALWAMESASPRVPTDAQLQQALGESGPGAFRLQGRTLEKRSPGVQFDLGGIAKGYAVDRAAEILLRAGIRSATINAGGDLRLLGDRQGEPWRIGIQHPRESGAVIATLALRGGAVVTSGDYERYFERDGIRYHHLFDPQTGRPARGCQSVTVVAPDAASADALATAVFVLGPQRGLALLEELPEVDGLIIAADGRRLATAALAGRVTWQ